MVKIFLFLNELIFIALMTTIVSNNQYYTMASSLTLKKIPEDIYKYLLKQQGRIKVEKSKGVFGLEQTVYAIIRDCKRCEEKEDRAA